MDALTRFAAKVDARGVCWEWTAYTNEKGYGRFYLDGHFVRAHRAAWMLLVGPIPEGLEPDHLCKNRRCVNPDHLELVTHRINTLRGNTITAANAKLTACRRGHPFTPENTYVTARGSRRCRTCANDYKRRWKREQRGAFA